MTSLDIPEHDAEAALLEAVNAAIADKTTLALRGSGSKAFYGPPCDAARDLDVSIHQGVVAYEPTELAISVRAGTRLAALQDLLKNNGQHLPFEPPHFGPDATVGGMIASGLSGPRRPWAGAVRDAVLGVRIINGQGQALSFGGRVMKNVAGYDLSRLMTGSMGTLGVVLEVSLKVLPRPVATSTLSFAKDAREALTQSRKWAGAALPITATLYQGDNLLLRLEGGEGAVAEATKHLTDDSGGKDLDDDSIWADVREHRLAFFQHPGPLWRLSLPPATPWIDQLEGDGSGSGPTEWLVEWGGALRWLRCDAPGDSIRDAARRAGGHATLFRGSDAAPNEPRFAPLSPLLDHYHRRLKQALDPAGLFNPGRLYPNL